MTLDEVERRVVLARLRRFGGHRDRAARSLGVTTKTVYNLLARYAAGGHPVPPAPPPATGRRVFRQRPRPEPDTKGA